MAFIEKIATTVDVLATISLNASEIKALDALAGHGVDNFIALFYKNMGRAYLEPHEAGLRTFLKAVNGCAEMVRSAEECREFLALTEYSRQTKVIQLRKSLREAGIS